MKKKQKDYTIYIIIQTMNRKLQIYIELLLLHIWTKTICPLFHEKSQDWYELGFDIIHEILEKNQDLEIDEVAEEWYEQKAYDLLEEYKTILEEEIDSNDAIGKDNLLRWLYDKVDFACGNARWFIKEEQEEDYEETDEEIKDNPLNKM